jgi:hypothetical protein
MLKDPHSRVFLPLRLRPVRPMQADFKKVALHFCSSFDLWVSNPIFGPIFGKYNSGDQTMSGISDREKAFESKFAHDAELKFKAEARRNKLLGLWAGELLGKADTAAYASEVIMADFEEAGDDDVVRKVKGDFDAAGIAKSEAEIRAKMSELLAVAVEQLQA